jgi:hypothetical protein
VFAPMHKRKNNLSPVLPDIIKVILTNPEYWHHLNQLIKTCEPLVDAIGKLESH